MVYSVTTPHPDLVPLSQSRGPQPTALQLLGWATRSRDAGLEGGLVSPEGDPSGPVAYNKREDPTLLRALGGFAQVEGQLAPKGVDAHHAGVGVVPGQGAQLGGVARDTVQGFGDVRRSFQDDVLGREKRISL